MAYSPIKNDRPSLETVPEESKEVDLGDGSDTDVENGHADADETTSFVRRWPRVRIPRLSRNRPRPQRRSRNDATTAPLISSLVPWVINFVLAIALVSLSWKKEDTARSSTHLPPTDLLWTMAEDQIQYRLERTYASQDSPQSEYQGWPNDEIDRLWNEYEKGGSFRIDRQTAERLPYPTEHLAVEGHEHDYVAGLAVFHQLHCLNMVRKALWPSRYNSSMLDPDGGVNYDRWSHIDHCIEVVRRCITCHSDVAALTYDWVEESQMVIHQEMLHTCRNFDLIRDWAYARTFTAPMRAHVEGGKVVSYVDKPYGPAWEKAKVKKPEGWNYTKEDF